MQQAAKYTVLFLLGLLCAASTLAYAAEAPCSVIKEISKISPAYAEKVLQFAAGLDTTEEDLQGDSVAYTFLVPQNYDEYAKNISFGYEPESADAIFNKSVLMQTLPEAFTLAHLVEASAVVVSDHLFLAFGEDTVPFAGNGTALTFRLSNTDDPSDPTEVDVAGPVPEGQAFTSLLYLNWGGKVLKEDVPACQSIIQVLDNPLMAKPRDVQLVNTQAALQLKCAECPYGDNDTAGNCYTYRGCSCCNIYL